MSLATRCPVCQTVFRVVQDQLKVSEGWVRCGRCAKVFNAFEGLFDLEREFPALRSPTPSQRVLEDLATRNRQPRTSSWDDFDTSSRARELSSSPPASQPAPRTPGTGTVPAVSVQRSSAPGFASSKPGTLPPSAPAFTPSRPAAFAPSAPAFAPSRPGEPPSAPAFAPSRPGALPPSAPAFTPSRPAAFAPSAPAFAPSRPGEPPSAPAFAPSRPAAPTASAPAFAPSRPGAGPPPVPMQAPAASTGTPVRTDATRGAPSLPEAMRPTLASDATRAIDPDATRVVTKPDVARTAGPARAEAGAPPSVPFDARVAAAPDRDDGATIPPLRVATTAPSPARNEADPATGAASAMARPAATPPAEAVPPPSKATPRGTPEIAIRDEPAPVPGGAEVSDTGHEDESFESLFRSDGELAPPASADGVDIMLDGDVEPASLDPDDAVDSRLLTFVQEADRAERWRRPWVRAALALAAAALTVLLAAQLLVAQRDVAVAQWPSLRSPVQSLCAPLNCRIEPLRRIDQLGVDSSGLTRIDDGPVYRLVLVLRNRADTSLLMPSIDLSLTDAAGVLVSRRVLSAADLGNPRNTIGAGQELPLQALLMSADRPLTGYTIEIFYP